MRKPSRLKPLALSARRRWLASATLALALGGCAEYAEPTLTPAQQKKVQSNLLEAAPSPQVPVGAVVDGQIRLIGYDIDRTKAKPGEAVTITWYLEALAEPMADNNLFVHFQGRKNDRAAWMNLDHAPVEGLLPLRRLKKGQIVKDIQTFTIKADFPGGPAHIFWGLWRGDQRLKVTEPGTGKVDGEGRLQLAQIEVDAPAGVAEKNRRKPLAIAPRLPEGAAITLDGKLDEAIWATTRPTEWFTAPDGSNKPVPRTRARFTWDANFVYVAVEATDDDVWSTFTERDSNTWEQEVIELFIDADGDRKDYLELQVTPANVIFDARFESHRSDLAKARAWNMAGFKTAVSVDGTLNAREDVDRGYTIEMALPIAEVPGAKQPPTHGQTWRVNLFRWDLPKAGRQVASAFSPPIVGDFHALDRFGELRFEDAAAARAAQPNLGAAALEKAPIPLPADKLVRPMPGNPGPGMAPVGLATPASGAVSAPPVVPESAPASAAP
jgi:hypothetical protein